MLVLETNFGQGCPCSIGRKEEICCIVGNDPVLPEANWASDRQAGVRLNATSPQRVIRFVFGAIRDFVVDTDRVSFGGIGRRRDCDYRREIRKPLPADV